MYSNDLIDRVLLSPARQSGYQRLCIVSGYADPVMVSTHLDDLLSDHQVHIQLLVGMFPGRNWNGTVNEADWGRYKIRMTAFRGLTASKFGQYDSTFECRYVVAPPQIHTKLYVWLDADREPAEAFVGSPNYTRAGFSEGRQGEIVTSDDYRASCYDYFVEHWSHAISCGAPDIEQRLYDLGSRR